MSGRANPSHAELLEEAWDDVHAAMPAGWTVGPANHHPERQEWMLYAFDPSEQPKVALRSREWTAVAPTELLVVREMARCLRAISEGRVPK